MRALLISVLLLVAAGIAPAQRLNVVQVGDLAGTNGRWQAGEVTVAAPADVVQRWFTEVDQWPKRFPDDQWSRDLGRTADGRQVAEFKSKVLGRTLRVTTTVQPGLITYVGKGKGINTQGKIFITPVGPNMTKVIYQTTGELYGLTGALASENMKRDRAIKKLTADLTAVANNANAYAAAQRRGG
jgi:hypothetical protein